MIDRPMVAELREQGVLRDIDVQLVDSLNRTMAADVSDRLALLLALVSRAVGQGDVCLDLQKLTPERLMGARPDSEAAEGVKELWTRVCAALPADPAAEAKACDRLVGEGSGAQAFVLEGSRLYLRRFWCYERDIARRMLSMAGASEGAVLDASFETELAKITPFNEQQREAVRRAMTRHLTIISGGPGTGKTTTAAQILRMLAHQDSGLRVRKAAPTGKAAARMDESLDKAFGKAGVPDLGMERACTIERLLGFRPDSPYYRHDHTNPLAADVVLIDEASMIDLAKMAKLVDALGKETRLVLLGDMNQLASVQPGCVMSELCHAEGLKECVVELTESRRFTKGSAVDVLSREVNSGADKAAWSLVKSGTGEPGRCVEWRASSRLGAGYKAKPPVEFSQAICAGYAEFLTATDPAAVFNALAKFRVLCALRSGPQGVRRINSVIEEILSEPTVAGGLRGSREFYDHRVVLVMKNDYGINLFNGDVGVVLPDPERGEELVVYFEGAGGTFRKIPCRLLPEHETAFAMTVHKSQGSEFGNVLVILPQQDSPVLTKELIYTAITRTLNGVELWCEEETFLKGVARKVERSMGLSAKMK